MLLETDLEILFLKRRLEFVDLMTLYMAKYDISEFDPATNDIFKSLAEEYSDVESTEALIASLRSIEKPKEQS